jgi:hypothetical protein
MKQLSSEDIAKVAVPIPMTRADKLERWASLVERSNAGLALYDRIECRTQADLDAVEVAIHNTAFGIATRDPVLVEAGLTDHTIGGIQRFFELSAAELHEFSCNCGGEISNAEQARRLRDIKDRSTFGRAFAAAWNKVHG